MTQTQTRQPSGLYVEFPGQQPATFPLEHTDVQAQVAGNVARVEVRQVFANPFTTPIEATYIFPLPDEAAVDDMVIQIGDRTLQGQIQKREVAQQIYEQAKQRGQTAGLLEQERPNIFTQSVANILPGERIEVVIRYSDRLAYKTGDYEFVFPMVVGPRYIPGLTLEGELRNHGSAIAPMMPNQDTEDVPDGSRLNAPILPPSVRSRHDINVTVEIVGGVLPNRVRSTSHRIATQQQGDRLQITLAVGDTIPNKDLILRYAIAGEATQTQVLTQVDERGGHFSMFLIPAIAYQHQQYVPKDMVFLIDTSGSQMGAPLQKCQELMRRFIRGLHPQDTFNIMDFADATQQLSTVPLTNTPANRQDALNYIDRLHAGGGTRMLRGIRGVLNLPQVAGRLRNIVLLTDGYIGNENQIFAEVQKRLQPNARLHSFGAGSSVNRFLLNRIAETGRGISEVVRPDQPAETVAENFFAQINNPVLGNIQLHWQGMGAAPEMYPAAPPDLFAEQPLVVVGRKRDRAPGILTVTGLMAGGGYYEEQFAVGFEASGNAAIAQFWGRAKIKSLMNQMVQGETKLGVDQVTETALAYQLLSQYTAFVAVSEDVQVTHPETTVSTQVPVNMPEDVSYEGVFGNVGAQMPMVKRSRTVQAKASFPEERARGITPNLESDRMFQRMVPPLMAPAPAAAEIDEDAWGTNWASPSIDEEMLEQFDVLPSPPPPASAPPPSSAPQRQAKKKERKGLFAAFGRSAPSWCLVLKRADGLTSEAYHSLKAHLKQSKVTNLQAGVFVVQLVMTKGRIRRIVVDEQASQLTGNTVQVLRKILMTWRTEKTLNCTARVQIEIQPASWA